MGIPKMNETTDALRLLRSQSLSSVVQREIERQIMSGKIKAGSRINENKLSREIGVSRGPIREACRGLVEMGFLFVIVNRGFFVREVTRKDAIDVYEVRASLMRLAGETLARRITDSQLAILSDLIAGMTVAEDEHDFENFYALNREFHDRIVDFAENDRLKALCDGLAKELHLYRRRSLSQGGGLGVSNKEHAEILAALQARDPKRAGAALEDHIQAGKRRFFSAVNKQAKEQEENQHEV